MDKLITGAMFNLSGESQVLSTLTKKELKWVAENPKEAMRLLVQAIKNR